MAHLIAEIPTQAGNIYWPVNKLIPVTTDSGIQVMLSPLDIKEGYKINSLEFDSKIRIQPEIAQTVLFKHNSEYREAYSEVYESVNGISIPKMAHILYFGVLKELKEIPCEVPDKRFLEELIQEEFYSKRSPEFRKIDYFIAEIIKQAAGKYEGKEDIDIMLRQPPVIQWLRGTRRTLNWNVYQVLADYKEGWESFRNWVPESTFHESWIKLGSEYRYLSTVIGALTEGRIELVSEKDTGLPSEKHAPITPPGAISKEVLNMLRSLGVEGMQDEGINITRIHPIAIGRPRVVTGELTSSVKIRPIQQEYSSYSSVKEAMRITNSLRYAIMDALEFYTQHTYERKGDGKANIFQVTVNYLTSILPEDRYMILTRDYLLKMSEPAAVGIQLRYNPDMDRLIGEGRLDGPLSYRLKEHNLPDMSFNEAIGKMKELIPILPDRFIEHYTDAFRYVAHTRASHYKAYHMRLEPADFKLLHQRIKKRKDSFKKAYGLNFDWIIKL